MIIAVCQVLVFLSYRTNNSMAWHGMIYGPFPSPNYYTLVFCILITSSNIFFILHAIILTPSVRIFMLTLEINLTLSV